MLDGFSTITIPQPVSLSTHNPTLPPSADRIEDRSNHAFHVRQNGGVSKAQNFEAMRGQHTRPLAIPSLGLVRIMLAAIGFDHEATPQTAEVGDKGTNRDLSPEMGSLQLDPMAQRPPEPLFGGRHRGAHAFGEEALGWRGPGMSGLADGHREGRSYSCAYANVDCARGQERKRSGARIPHPVSLTRAHPPHEGEGKCRLIAVVYARRQQLLSPSWGEIREWGAARSPTLAPLQPRQRSGARPPPRTPPHEGEGIGRRFA